VRTVLRDADHVAVEIADNGHGIPADVLPKIFDPFFTTKPVGKGTGLGLSICYKIVEGHGGKLEVHSKPGLGTRFSVVLPVRTAAQAA
jgi:signal transduction histidine kinase